MVGLLAVSGAKCALANDSSYPFRTTVKVEPIGAGTAYATYTNRANTATDNERSYDGTGYSSDRYSCTTSVTLVASPGTGYRFLRWEDENGNSYSNTATTTASLVYDVNGASYETNYTIGWPLYWFPYSVYSTRRVFTFTAKFALQGNVIARVLSGQENIGVAYILEEELHPGEPITLVASNINGSEFDGWYFDHWELNGQSVSTSKEYKVTVPTSNQTLTYIAHFKKSDTEYYCFIRNKKTGRYLRLSDWKNYTGPTSDANPVGSFNGSFTLVDEGIGITDPACVFTIDGTSNSSGIDKASLTSQGVSVGFKPNSKIINDNTNGLTISQASQGAYFISTNYHWSQYGQSGDIPLYFRDNNGIPDVSNVISDASQWEILELSSATLSQNFFGLAPNSALKMNGKYYTTLYTTFPYELQSGTAYYINHESIVHYGDEGKFRVVCKKVEDGRVPADKAVIIECEGTEAANNKILPLPRNASVTAIGQDYVKGHITFRDGDVKGDGKIHVLSVGSSSGLGIYKLSSKTSLPDNKAYFSLEEEEQYAVKNMTMSFGDDIGTPTIIEETAMPEDIAGQPVYDLQGRKVVNPSNGIYIVNGKKLVIK